MTQLIPLFSGLPNEDAERWLQKFIAYTELKGIHANNQRTTGAFLTFLSGQAETWYNGLEDDTKNNRAQLFQAFRDRFNIIQPATLLSLQGRKLSPTETIDNYANDIERYCSQLQMTEQQKIYQFLSGLDQSVFVQIMLTKPATLADAIHSARIVLMTTNRSTQPTPSPQPATHTAVNYTDGFMAGIKAATDFMQQPTSAIHNFHQLHQPAPAPTCAPVGVPFNVQPQHSASCNACHALCHFQATPQVNAITNGNFTPRGPRQYTARGGQRNFNIVCHKCGAKGHIKRYCTNDVVCQLCTQKGHDASKCWKLFSQSNFAFNNTSQSNTTMNPNVTEFNPN